MADNDEDDYLNDLDAEVDFLKGRAQELGVPLEKALAPGDLTGLKASNKAIIDTLRSVGNVTLAERLEGTAANLVNACERYNAVLDAQDHEPTEKARAADRAACKAARQHMYDAQEVVERVMADVQAFFNSLK